MTFEVPTGGDGQQPVGRRARAVAGLLLGVAVTCAAATVAGRVVNRNLAVSDAFSGDSSLSWVTDSCSALLFGVPGWYLATRRPRLAFGWLALAAGVGHGLSGIGLEWIAASELGGRSLPAVGLAVWFVAWGSLVELPVLAATFALYPDGRLPRSITRVLAVVSLVLATAGLLVSAANPDPVPVADESAAALRNALHNPLGLAAFGQLADAVPAFFAPALLLSCVALVVRWRAAAGDHRRVLSWMVVVAVPTVVVVPVAILALPDSLGVTIAQGSTLLVMATLVSASLRHRVYGIDVVLNRALVYGSLTAIVAVVYAGAVGLGSLLGATGSGELSFVAALAAALALIPAHQRVQRGVDRLLYGSRGEPYRVVSHVARRLGAAESADQLLPSFVEAAATVLKVPYIAVEFDGPDGRRQVSYGDAPAQLDSVGLDLGGRPIGTLVIGRRAGQSQVGGAERELLVDLARQATAAASNVILTEELRRSRERIITAREEERRRLRRDLHDGLGPQLTGIALGLDVLALGLEPTDPVASSTADKLRDEVHEAIRDVRRLVLDLRPPRLDEVGLAGAIREVAARISRGELVVVVDSGDLPSLPAAVEVAMFRITNEALNNVARHSGARCCSVRLAAGTNMEVTVLDDGRGLGSSEGEGVGVRSMRERAEELGGWCTVEDAETTGCRVSAAVPLGTP